jgi:hypothetical protein
MKRPPVVHPFLFVLSTLVFFYATNLGRIALAESWVPMLMILLPVGVIQLFLLRTEKARKAGVVLSLFIVLFFSYGQVYEVLEDVHVAGFGIRHDFLVTVWLLLLVLGTRAALRTRSDLANLTRILNFMGAVLVVMPLGNIAWYRMNGGILWGWSRPTENPAPLTANHRAPQNLPDIYYIVLDRYASEETLRVSYDYDNREFLDFLRSRGFYVAEKSHSNYLKTALSLASTLSMEYLDHFTRDPGRRSTDWIPVFSRLKDYRVWRFLKSRGYKFIHLGTRYEPTRRNPNADVNVNVLTPPQVILKLTSQTMLRPFGKWLGIPVLDSRLLEWTRIPYQLERTVEIAKDPQPTFAFVHLLAPHEPYVFDQDGSFVTEEVVRQRTRRENYRNQLIYTNRKVREALERLLATSPAPPVIIVQGDEGPIPIGYPRERADYNWKQATVEELKEKSGILNAYYLPGVEHTALYPGITPVNSFRLLFNLYFDTNFPLLPDEHYGHADDVHPYDFFSITDKLRGPDDKAAAASVAARQEAKGHGPVRRP